MIGRGDIEVDRPAIVVRFPDRLELPIQFEYRYSDGSEGGDSVRVRGKVSPGDVHRMARVTPKAPCSKPDR